MKYSNFSLAGFCVVHLKILVARRELRAISSNKGQQSETKKEVKGQQRATKGEGEGATATRARAVTKRDKGNGQWQGTTRDNEGRPATRREDESQGMRSKISKIY